MSFCIKNYDNPKGLSSKIHGAASRFEVKGPMGPGLRPHIQGDHIAFAAGTGVLCFVDLVAEIARVNMETDRDSLLNTNDRAIEDKNEL